MLLYAITEAADEAIDEGMNAVDAALLGETDECVCVRTIAVEEDGMDAINVLLREVESEKRAELQSHPRTHQG